ncbi:MAG: flagellar basal body P-ring formation chaperone FlgA [Pyrinomonadaceae bacterium]
MKKAPRKYGPNLEAQKIALLCSIIFSCVAAASGQAVAIRVSQETTVATDRVELGKIARISGQAVAVERLKRISLGYAPNIGLTREIGREQITLAINAAGFANSEFTLETPPRINIHRAGQIVPQEAIRAAVEKALADHIGSNGVSINILDIQIPGKIEVAAGGLDVRIGSTDIRSMFERFSIPVEIRVDGKKERSFSANVEIEAFAEVFVAANDILANTQLGRSDLRLERRKLVRSITNYFRDPDSLRGMRVIKNIASGDALTADSCVPSVVIRSGDTVRIEARSGNMKIIIAGEARTSGKIGDRIAVKNKESGAILQAVVVDEGLVKVIL